VADKHSRHSFGVCFPVKGGGFMLKKGKKEKKTKKTHMHSEHVWNDAEK
jgi:hypothetical protein